MKRLTFTFILICIAATTAQAQQEKALFTIDRMEWINPWLRTSNAAGLSGNAAFLSDTVKGFNDASAAGSIAAGGYKNIYDAERQVTGTLGIDSFMKLKRVFLHGKVGYRYEYGTNHRWRGLVNPYEMPFMVADSIPGNMSNEIYSLEAGIGIPLKNGWAIGVNTTYNASIMAKHKDLRNKNTYMEFDITPGVSYTGKLFLIGLNLGFLRNTEKIEYMQVDASTEKYLFDLYGMWLYSSNGFSSAEGKRYKLRNEYYGSLQLGFSFSNIRIFNNFEARYTDASQTETGYNNLHHGDIHKFLLSDSFSLLIGRQHRIDISASGYRMNGFRFLQRQELDPDSKVRIWVTYGDPVFCYDRCVTDGMLSYTFRKLGNTPDTDGKLSPFDVNWEISAAVKGYTMRQNYYEHPVQFSQKYSLLEPMATFSKYWKKGSHLFDLTPSLSYTIPTESGHKDDVTAAGAKQGESPWQLEEPLAKEYSFFTSERVNASLSIRYAHILKKASTIYIKGTYLLHSVTKGDLQGEARHSGTLTIGYTF